MKNKSNSRIVRLFHRIFNVKLWADTERMKGFTLYLWNGFKKFFVPQSAKATESFDVAIKRLKLTDSDIQARKKGLFRLSLLMLFIAILLFFYTIYQLFYGNIIGIALSLIVMAIALTQAFRYHFWYFQFQKRKLGCTIHEWYRQGLMGDKK